MNRMIFITILLFVVSLLVACGEDVKAIAAATAKPTQADPSTVPYGGPVEDTTSLLDSLRAVGAKVELAGKTVQPFFTVTSQLVKVNGGDVQVFEYRSEVAAKEEAALVSPDGSSVGTSMMSWMATPHFYRLGKLIVLYVGDDATITEALETALGPQFAGRTPEAAVPPADSCPAATTDMRLLTNEAHGYCLLYPTQYKVERPNPDETVLVIGSLLNSQDPRVSIVVGEADGSSAEELADASLAAVDGFDVTRTITTVGGEEAVVLDNLPGQEVNRQLWLVHDDRAYHMTFTPADESLGEPYTQMEALYELVTDSFTLVPPVDAVAPSADCLEANADEKAYTSEAYSFCLLLPEGYDVDEDIENQVALYVGSLMDVEHPKAFINVEDAAGSTAEQAAEAKVAEIEDAMPGYAVERTFGLSVGYQPAWVLENVPGQDIGRQVYVVHDGRLYTLTFVPADPSAGEVYVRMEELYATILNSFRFLR